MLLVADTCSQILDLQHGTSALHFAAKNGHAETTRSLIELGFDARLTDKVIHFPSSFPHANHALQNGCSPLYYAVASGKEDVVDIILQSGARIQNVRL